MQVAHAQAVKLQEMFAQQRAALVKGYQAELIPMRLDCDFEQRRPAAQHRATQAEQQPLSVHRQTFDVKAVVLARDRHVGAKVGIVGQDAGEQVRLRIAFEPQCLAAVLSLTYQAGLTLSIGLDGQTCQQAAIGVERHFCQPFGVVGVTSVRLDVLALEAMRTNHPEVAIGHRHAFQVGLIIVCTGQVQQLSQRKIADFAKMQGLAAYGVKAAQAIQTTGFVACHPEPIAGEGCSRQVVMNQGVRCELKTNGIRDSGFGHGMGFLEKMLRWSPY
ncbi:hypothetical protein AX13_12480 [Comamonas aquatica DA1877]|uniref:Uncharacterized protein n=1 Tax=Comamonas aquatica DA1877 TaxID=1457173 RepID=A0A014M9L9_9BURK|nr:hypothetical protein AX13_12480 [Comamonas aquatica DA1877]